MKEVLTFTAIFLLAMGVVFLPYIFKGRGLPVDYRTLPAPFGGPVYKRCPDGTYPCRKGNGPYTCDCPTI